MGGNRIDGKLIAESVTDDVAALVGRLRGRGIEPRLATVLVGDDPASATYVRNKHRACGAVGIQTQDHRLPSSTTQEELAGLVSSLNGDKRVHGILVQLPLPGHLDAAAITAAISPAKDVDGLTPQNAGLLSMGKAPLAPCTPLGIIRMLEHHGVPLQGSHVVIINRSSLIGRPLYQLLLARNATVTTCHSKTVDISRYTRQADVVVTGVGDRSRFVLRGDMIKEGAVVIDVAITRHGGSLAGDADYDDVASRASLITPVPGGVGPMTVAMLLRNTVEAAALIGE